MTVAPALGWGIFILGYPVFYLLLIFCVGTLSIVSGTLKAQTLIFYSTALMGIWSIGSIVFLLWNDMQSFGTMIKAFFDFSNGFLQWFIRRVHIFLLPAIAVYLFNYSQLFWGDSTKLNMFAIKNSFYFGLYAISCLFFVISIIQLYVFLK